MTFVDRDWKSPIPLRVATLILDMSLLMSTVVMAKKQLQISNEHSSVENYPSIDARLASKINNGSG